MLKSKRWFFLLPAYLTATCYADDKLDSLYKRVTHHDIQAINELHTLAKENNISAIMKAGFIHQYGVGVSADAALAAEYYEQACELNVPEGCYNARYFYQYGQGVTQDTVRAQLLANKSQLNFADRTLQWASNRLDMAKLAAVQDPAKRAPLIALLRNLNLMSGTLINRLGLAKVDVLHLAEWWAQDNDPELIFQLAQLYEFNYINVEDNDAVAMKWFRKAAELGQADAQNVMGYMYFQGKRGLTQDVHEGKRWYQLAAKQGNHDALTNLGEIYYLGEVVPVDYARAYSLFAQAANLNDPEGQAYGNPRAWKYLAWMYTNGQHVKADCKKAVEYFANGQTGVAKSENFLATCEKDKVARRRIDNKLPDLTLQYAGTFMSARDDGYACQLHFIVDTSKLGEVANLRVTVNVKHRAGAVSTQTLAFAPFGSNSLNVNRQGREYSSFRSPARQTIQQAEFCSVQSFEATAATATYNGKEVDMLKVLTLKH
jgi:TPR repeat protein